MAQFFLKADGKEYCTKYLRFELTREQDDFCKIAAGCRAEPDENWGGGKGVDDYLKSLLFAAVEDAMRKRKACFLKSAMDDVDIEVAAGSSLCLHRSQ